ncbi:MAG: hypothetical protein A3G41_04915 [Elusimicrobia bacterium RIFCSPLOWO2_12_FULL_59_9]|nr:MAG: hypothetical protein A3G41_04915 [Elusimicrobia bacterium RIFCSPLOWO2_12_FULL_59_9]
MESFSAEKKLETSPQLEKLPPYLFVDIDRKKRAAIDKGLDVINLGIGDPDLPTPDFIVEKAASALRNPAHHRYPSGKGGIQLREAIARWMRERYAVALDPETEILALIGSKEGIGHLPRALCGPGDFVLTPDPGYPPYRSGTILAGAEPFPLRLAESRGFLPDLEAIPPEILLKSRLLFLNYPNNPTGAGAPPGFFEEVVGWAGRRGIWIAHDAAYAEMRMDGLPPASFLQAAGSKDIGLEFHSLSKSFNMTGWRVGWACGNARALKALAQVKDNFDSGVFGAVQEAAIEALGGGLEAVRQNMAVYKKRRENFAQGLEACGWKIFAGAGTFYLWCQTPPRCNSMHGVEKLLDDAQIVAVPGSGFGRFGEGYVRFTVTEKEDRLKTALLRIAQIKW